MFPKFITSLLIVNFLFIFQGNYCRSQDVMDLQNDSVDAPIPSKPLRIITRIPSDLWQLAKSPFKKNSIPALGIIAGSTALMYYYDDGILKGITGFSVRNNIDTNTSYKKLLKIGDQSFVKIPLNATSIGYTLGEGWTGLAIAGGLFISGKIGKSTRPLQTAGDLVEGFISTAIVTQAIKRITGRESPFVATAPRGRWRPFPSFKEYQNNTPSYDAFPSGHLTTMMLYTTILADNYPEKKWIRILGYSLITYSSLAMMNTEVHWASDYPLAIAIGYVQAKIITSRHKVKTKKPITL